MSRLKGSGREGRNIGNIGGGKPHARGPIDTYRKKLGEREKNSVVGKRERSALVQGHDNALRGSGVRSFFTSTPFLLTVLVLMIAGISFAFWKLANTHTVRMNQPPLDFKAPTDGQVKYSVPQAIQH